MGLATLWGIVSRLHVLLPALAVAIWRPRFVGLQVGSTVSRWRMLALMLVVNCGIVALFVLVAGATPFSGDQWLITETVTVPLVEELMWRGVVLSFALHLLTRVRAKAAVHVAVWFAGLAFGVLHLGNALTGAPASFAVLQAVSAAAWGVLYGYARTSTDSIYPPILLHAAMNATVVLLS